MKARQVTVFGPGFMLAMLLAAFATFAQEASDVDSMQPAVDTSAMEPAVDTSAAVADDDGDDAEPESDAAALEPDITRQESGGQVMDRMELGTTEVTGNSELPTVLYIVPWQKSDPGNLTGKPVNTLLQEILEPLDREEFLRGVDYYDELSGNATDSATEE